jgi:hypothetical protein
MHFWPSRRWTLANLGGSLRAWCVERALITSVDAMPYEVPAAGTYLGVALEGEAQAVFVVHDASEFLTHLGIATPTHEKAVGRSYRWSVRGVAGAIGLAVGLVLGAFLPSGHLGGALLGAAAFLVIGAFFDLLANAGTVPITRKDLHRTEPSSLGGPVFFEIAAWRRFEAAWFGPAFAAIGIGLVVHAIATSV